MERTVDELKHFEDKYLLELLQEDWGIKPQKKIEVIGELKRFVDKNDRSFVVLKNIRSLTGEELEYPIKDLYSRDRLSERGVFVAGYADNNDDW
jgi:hypothetical protein